MKKNKKILQKSSQKNNKTEELKTEYIPPELENELKEIPLQKREKIIALLGESWSAPLPRPKDFKNYNEVMPGAAQKIIKMAEKEQNFRHDFSYEKLDKTYCITILSSILSFIVIIAMLGATIFLYYLSESAWLAGVLIGEILCIASLFFWWTKKEKS